MDYDRMKIPILDNILAYIYGKQVIEAIIGEKI